MNMLEQDYDKEIEYLKKEIVDLKAEVTFLKKTVREKNSLIRAQSQAFEQTSSHLNQVIDETRNRQYKITTQKEFLEKTVKELKISREEIGIQKKLLEGTLKELDDAYSNITASITYAKRIQDAMLPQLDTIRRHVQDLFVLFKPRDIVSGDFYWFAHKKGKTIIAAVDCTGHGVPGAFMSMIGNNLLHDIVFNATTLEADDILNQLHRGVRRVLKQEETENRDGMDIALCIIDKKKKILQYAGAYNPLIMIRDREEIYIHGDRKAIGGYQKDDQHEFTKHSIPIREGLIFYIFSDGYQDQFGGPFGRRFMAKRLRRVLFDIHHHSFAKQHRILNRIINYWMRGHPQLDDILIIGAKV